MEAKTNTDIQPKSEQAEQRFRPFGIIDLIVVTTAMAVLFKLQSVSMANEEHPIPDWILLPLLFLNTTVMALSLSAAYWFLVHYHQTGKLFRHPGHWILCSSLIMWTGWLIYSICYAVFEQLEVSSWWESIQPVAILFVALTFLLGTIPLVIGTFSHRGRWGVAKVGLAVFLSVDCFKLAMMAIAMFGSYGFFEVSNFLGIIANVLGVLLAFCIAILITVDLTKKVKRDWLHWIGLIVILVYLTAIPLMQFILNRYMMSQLDS